MSDKTNAIYGRERWIIVPGVGILDAWGITVPTDGEAGFAIGCTYKHIDGGDGTALYVNEGTLASCDFNAITVA
jgi:hypothetical protein